MAKSREVKTVDGISLKTGTRPLKDSGNFRDWQRECLKKLDSSKRALILAPTGSGKSTIAMARGAIMLARNPGLKHLVSVPQNIIATSFTKEGLEDKIPGVSWPGIGVLSWSLDPTNTIESGSKIDELYKFITTKSYAPSKRLMVCSHQALVLVFKRLKEAGNLTALKNVFLTIDEVHHSASMTLDEDEAEVDLENKLGEIVGHFFKQDLRLDMFTATWMRANFADIIPAKYEAGKDYAKYVRYMDEHLESLNFKGGVLVRFLIGTPEEALKHVYQEDPTMKTIVYLPAVKSWIMQQYEGKQEMLSKFQRVLRSRALKTIDLVTEADRDSRKDAFLASIGSTKEPDLLWALNMCKEGFDWPSASRSVVIGPRGSMVDLIQMLGRLLRPGPKSRVEFNIVFPVSGKPDPDQVQAYLNFMIQSLVVEWQFRRPKLKKAREQKVMDELFLDNPTLGQKVLQACVNVGINADENTDAIEAVRKGLDRADLSELSDESKDIMAPLLSRLMAKGLLGINEVPSKAQLVKQVFGKVRAWSTSFGYKDLREIREGQGRKGWLTEEMIWEAAQAWYKRTGEWPNCTTNGVIPGLSKYTWAGIDTDLRRGHRGLSSGSGISKLLASKGILNRFTRETLNSNSVWEAAQSWYERTGKWPTRSQGNIPEFPGYTWMAIDQALRFGYHGLSSESSLSQFLASKGAINWSSKKDLTYEKIWEVAQSWYERTGKWPTTTTKGKIPEIPTTTWGSLNASLTYGGRGLPGGLSLSQFIASKGGLNRGGKEDLNLNKVWKAVLFWHKNTQKFPRADSKGMIPTLPGYTWPGVDANLRKGTRGLPGGSSLSKLIKEMTSQTTSLKTAA